MEVFWRKTGDKLDGNLNSTLIYFHHSKELPMSTQSIIQQVRWQDLKVRSDAEVVFELAKKECWEDCEVFGSGDMITEPRETTGWKLIPADVYEGKIPAEAVKRLYQVIVAGIRVRGVIIADDERAAPPPPTPVKPRISLSTVTAPVKKALSVLSRVPAILGGLFTGLGRSLTSLGRMLVGLIKVVGMIAVVSVLAYWVISYAQIILAVIQYAFLITVVACMIIMMIIGGSPATGRATTGEWEYDPKLVILVDDGSGGTTWVSLFTWYE